MPVLTDNLNNAIEQALNETGIPTLATPNQLISLLTRKGLDLETIAQGFVDVLQSSRSSTKYKVLMDLCALYGIDFRKPEQQTVVNPTINVTFSDKSGSPINVQMNNMFNPIR